MLFHQRIDSIFTPRESSIPGFEENQVRRMMRFEDGLVLVALDGEKVVGYTLAEIKKPPIAFTREKHVNIIDAAVTASYRRKGVGKALFLTVFSWAKEKGITRMELSTAAKNMVANSFWQKQGFEIYMHTLTRKI